MSEIEKKQRDQYQIKRRKQIRFQMIVAAVLVLATLAACLSCVIMSRNAYVRYTEDGKAETKVLLADNSFYDGQYLDSDHAYVADLIKMVETKFQYGLIMDAAAVNYKYSYTVVATVNVIDDDSEAPLYDPSFVLKEVTDAQSSDRELLISETVELNYAEYNQIAEDFVNSFDITDATAALVLRMNVSVLGESETFVADKSNNYTVEVSIPLLRQTVKLVTSTSVSTEEQKITVSDSVLMSILCVLWRVLGVLSVAMCVFIAVFTVKTRDKHIDYSRKVQKLLSSYKSYIHRVENIVSFDGCNVLKVVTFEELLEIGDKLQNPVLMHEDEDRTKSTFFIATANSLVYLYEIAVEDDRKKTPAAVL